MISVNAVLLFNDEQIVPVRAVPFVTSGDIGPKCLARMLADPEQRFWAYVLGSDRTAATMLPKNWRQYGDRLTVAGQAALDLIDRSTLEILPTSTFVYWESLWRTHEANFLPDRDAIEYCSPAEKENYALQPQANIPTNLVDLVFEGFSALPLVKPVSRATAQDQEILALLKSKGFTAASLPKNSPGKPGVKAIIRDSLGRSGMWGGSTIFDKAWDRLHKNGDIATKD